jgi:hypothetical protein
LASYEFPPSDESVLKKILQGRPERKLLA